MEYFADESNLAIIQRLAAAGLQFEAQQADRASAALEGLNFVISGSFANHSRDELKALIEAHGGKNLAAVSANTSYLLAGDKIGPAKLQKATKLGINIISEDDFMAMIADAEPLDNNISKAENEESAAESPAISEAKSESTSQAPIQGTLF